MPTDSEPTDRQQDVSTDTTQLIPPRIETTMRVTENLTLDQFMILAPGILSFLVSAFAFLMQTYWIAFGGALFTLFFTVVGMFTIITTKWHETPKHRLEMWFESNCRRGTLPIPLASLTDITSDIDVREITDDGITVHDDEHLSTHVRMNGRNTANVTDSERDRITAQWSAQIDERIKSVPWCYYATTFDFDPTELVSHYYERADTDESIQTGSEALTKEALLSIADWQTTSAPPTPDGEESFPPTDYDLWTDRNWRTYIELSVEPDVATTELWSITDYLHPFRSATEHYSERRDLVRKELRKRTDTVENALANVPGITTERVGRNEEAAIHINYWTGRPDATSLVDRLDTESLTGETDSDSEGSDTLLSLTSSSPLISESLSKLKRTLVPYDFEERDTHVRVGDTLCRTYWIADWPEEPRSMFLRKLWTMTDIDASVKVTADPIEKRGAIDSLEDTIVDIDAEGLDRADESDLAAGDVAADVLPWVKMRELLRTTTAQPWHVSMYVTVRANDRATLAELEDPELAYETPDDAHFGALTTRCRRVRDTLESTPAELLPLSAGRDHLSAFLACAPGHRDDFAGRTGDRSIADRIQRRPTQNPRERWMLSGALGAMFPPCSGVIHEQGSDAYRWGRNLQNHTMMNANPFNRGETAHGGIIGKSRSGKSYDVQSMLNRWYLGGDDRTLILCDTQGEFVGLTEYLGGEHIMLDGKTHSINPFAISPAPDWMRNNPHQSNVDPYGMKIESIVNFISGIIASQDADPSDYYPVIEQAAQNMYDEAGIYRSDLDSHSNPDPTGWDFLTEVEKILEQEGEGFWKNEAVQSTINEWTAEMLARLSTFHEGGRHHWLMGEDRTNVLDPDVDMIYLDLSQLRYQRDIEMSATLGLAFDQVSQKIRQSTKSIAAFDEAHELLHSDRSTAWLEAASREWARYDAGLWLISQSPREFIERASADTENRRQNILGQWSWMKVYHTPRVNTDLLTQPPINMNSKQASLVSNGGLIPGKRGRGFSTCLTYFEDRQGWWHTRIEASPFEHLIYTYDPGSHGDFYEYLLEEAKDHPTIDTTHIKQAVRAHRDEETTRTETDATNPDPVPASHAANDLLCDSIEGINGVGPTYSERLGENDITTVQDVLTYSASDLAAVSGAPESTAYQWLGQAKLIRQLLSNANRSASNTTPTELRSDD